MPLGDRPLGLQGSGSCPTPTTGRSIALRIADGMNIAYPGGVHRRLDHEQARRGDADRGVDVVHLTGRFDDAGRRRRRRRSWCRARSASSPQMRTPSANRYRPRRTAATMSTSDPAQCSSGPPYASLRWFVAGDRKPRTIDEWEHWSSMPSARPPHNARRPWRSRRRSRRSRPR